MGLIFKKYNWMITAVTVVCICTSYVYLQSRWRWETGSRGMKSFWSFMVLQVVSVYAYCVRVSVWLLGTNACPADCCCIKVSRWVRKLYVAKQKTNNATKLAICSTLKDWRKCLPGEFWFMHNTRQCWMAVVRAIGITWYFELCAFISPITGWPLVPEVEQYYIQYRHLHFIESWKHCRPLQI